MEIEIVAHAHCILCPRRAVRHAHDQATDAEVKFPHKKMLQNCMELMYKVKMFIRQSHKVPSVPDLANFWQVNPKGHKARHCIHISQPLANEYWSLLKTIKS